VSKFTYNEASRRFHIFLIFHDLIVLKTEPTSHEPTWGGGASKRSRLGETTHKMTHHGPKNDFLKEYGASKNGSLVHELPLTVAALISATKLHLGRKGKPMILVDVRFTH
jgi:hypothetical protein